MKLTIKRQGLEKLISICLDCIPTSTADNCLRNFLLTVDESKVKLLASDGNISIEGELLINEENSDIVSAEPGSIQIPAKTFSDIIKNFQSELITLMLVDNSVLYVSDEFTRYNLRVVDAREYPNIDLVPSNATSFTIPYQDFLTLYKHTNYACAIKGRGRDLFTGINIKIENSKLYFIATDAFRLAMKSIPLSGEEFIDVSKSVTVPVKSLATLGKIEADTVTFNIENSKIIFQLGHFVVASTIYGGEFPDVRRIIPDKIHYKLVANSQNFLSALERITAVGNDNVQMICHSNSVEISSRNTNVGNSKEELHDIEFKDLYLSEDVEVDDNLETFSVIFNANFVKDAVSGLDCQTVTLSFASDVKAFQISSDDSSDIQIVTPIRTLNS